MNLADRARLIAEQARAKAARMADGPKADYVVREWYTLGDGVELFLYPPQTLEWVRERYSQAEVKL